ncbi:MAG: MT-A70 family methyltransferase [Methylocella sp.]
MRDAANEDSERFGKLQTDMDRTGRVDGPYKRLKAMPQSEAIRKEPPPLPSQGPYRVIVADPPWPYEIRKEDPSHRATHPYGQMSIAQICALNIGPLAHTDCLLWLSTTNHHIREAFTVLDAWGSNKRRS